MEAFTNRNPHNQQQQHGEETMHELAGLSCVDHNGPESIESASDVVYWSNIPSDAEYKSPFYDPSEEKYLTFEPDHG
eukprot:8280102-Ditylum_brightwellii.AAC.1